MFFFDFGEKIPVFRSTILEKWEMEFHTLNIEYSHITMCQNLLLFAFPRKNTMKQNGLPKWLPRPWCDIINDKYLCLPLMLYTGHHMIITISIHMDYNIINCAW